MEDLKTRLEIQAQESEIPSIKTPHLIVRSIFLELRKETEEEILFQKLNDKEYAMFPYLGENRDGKLLGWLALEEHRENYTVMSYHGGFRPYQVFKKEEIPFGRPLLIITGGYTKCGEPSDQEEGFPNVRINIISSDHAFSSGANQRELICLNKLISKIIILNDRF